MHEVLAMVAQVTSVRPIASMRTSEYFLHYFQSVSRQKLISFGFGNDKESLLVG